MGKMFHVKHFTPIMKSGFIIEQNSGGGVEISSWWAGIKIFKN